MRLCHTNDFSMYNIFETYHFPLKIYRWNHCFPGNDAVEKFNITVLFSCLCFLWLMFREPMRVTLRVHGLYQDMCCSIGGCVQCNNTPKRCIWKKLPWPNNLVTLCVTIPDGPEWPQVWWGSEKPRSQATPSAPQAHSHIQILIFLSLYPPPRPNHSSRRCFISIDTF